MAVAIDEEELAEIKEEKHNTLRPEDNHCPFGCDLADLDENGYCEHLVGFTNTPKVGGRIENIVTNPLTETKTVNGWHKRKPKFRYKTPDGEKLELDNPAVSEEKVKAGDQLVNPKQEQFVNGAKNIATMWVSTRVYRQKQEKTAKKAS